MQGTESLEALKEQIASHPKPVLSVYLNVNPARPENRKKACLVRLKDALKEEGVPRGMATRLLEYVEGEQFQARTLVLFAAPDDSSKPTGCKRSCPKECAGVSLILLLWR